MMRRLLPLLLLATAFAAPAHAYQWRLGDATNALVMSSGESLAEESFWMARRLDIGGRTARDLWLLAQADIRFTGETAGDLRAFGNAVTLAGVARENVLAYANNLHLTTNAVVGGELALFGANIICEGRVEGDAWIMARAITLAGEWRGSLHLFADEIRVAPGTTIAGDVIYSAARPLVMDESVRVGGEVKARAATATAAGAASLQPRLLLHGYLFMAALLVGMPFVGFFPFLAGGAVRTLRTTPWRALLTGAVALLFFPFLTAFIIMTVVGIPLGLLLGALYLAMLYLSHIVIALWLGHLILRAPGPQSFGRVLAALAVGLFILYFLAALPGFGALLMLPVLAMGSGTLLLAFTRRPVLPLPPPPPPVPEEPTENP
ncbi:MAG: hypothetical protein KBF08_05000 [Kiritimatiellae bacterium]|jgi:cytoskeletal protein CcmA (bactofilin family)|nr:hypothetical protein [Kiritimatiellia bacterium]MBP9572402.1 hypothetical protein [Kiritimatiellia bacterium]